MLNFPTVTFSFEDCPDIGRAIIGENNVRAAVPLQNSRAEEGGKCQAQLTGCCNHFDPLLKDVYGNKKDLSLPGENSDVRVVYADNLKYEEYQY